MGWAEKWINGLVDFWVGKLTAETRRRRVKYFNHGWTRMDTDKKAGLTRMARMAANGREFFGNDFR